ncbi:hypothetical protein [Virgibacillus sp. CBA3643]|uniref:hypothetical protein n=1 Tax=Virgibacillus sp. CBA3643 TaxID=2942278 RepID=UPI0035A323CB
MKQIEIKQLTVGSAIKATIYLMFIPIIIMLLVVAFVVLIGIVQEGAAALIALPIMLFGSVLYIGIYIGIVALITLIYNWLAGKFGGLVITVHDKDSIEGS